MVLRTPIPNAMAGVDYQPVVGWERHVVGIDLGTLRDPTAIVILRDTLRPAPKWGAKYRQLFEPREMAIVQAFRLKLGIDWPEIVDFIGRMQRSPSLAEASFIVDTSGLGAVAGSMLTERKVKYTGVTITAGEGYSENGPHYRASKMYLLTNLATLLQAGTLKISTAIRDAKALRQQIDDFTAVYTPSGNLTFRAKENRHDDLVLAACLAAFGTTLTKGAGLTVSQLAW